MLSSGAPLDKDKIMNCLPVGGKLHITPQNRYYKLRFSNKIIIPILNFVIWISFGGK